MSPEPTPEKPSDAYARALEDQIVKDARASADSWACCGDPGRRPAVTGRLVVGLAIMTAGLVLALDSLGLVDGGAVFRFWPLVLIAVGVVKWISPPRQGTGAFIWILAGIGFLLVTLGLMPVSRIWALLLFFIGANIAWRALRPRPQPQGDPSSAIDTVAVLGGTKTVSRSLDFRGGQAMATLGGCEIDLRQASMPEGGEAVIDAFAFWGGIEIKVPEEWEVVNRVNAFLGGFDNKAYSQPNATRRLIVTGTAIMGGIEVKN